MGRIKLTQQEMIALLVNIKNELNILFNELDIKQNIVANLSSLIKEEFKVDPESEDIYKIFDN